MISQLEGKIAHTDSRFLILDVNGVGYKIAVSPDTLEKASKKNDQKVRFWTHLAVREDALDLYGFLSQEEHDFFGLLISISGIGPKTAMGILSVASIETLRSAVVTGEPGHLMKISGIGKKNAEKIVLELKSKVHATEEERNSSLRDESDSVEALRALGYSQNEARDALKKVAKEISNTGERVKQALKLLGSKTK